MKFDVIENIGAVRREVRDCERDGRPARAVVAERTYETTVDDLWDAITDGDRIPRWFLPIEGDLRLGGRYQLVGNAGGEVMACEPPTHLAVTWEFGQATTWLDVTLAPADGGARLRLEHVALVDDPDQWDEFGPGAVGIGWDLTLLGLGEHIRTGEAVAAEADPMGPDGMEYMTRSSDAWYEADVAAGTGADDARARADRTIAAYTGDGGDGGHPEG